MAHIRERLRTGYWLVPGVMVGAYLGLAALMLHADDVRPALLVATLSWFAVPGAEGSRAVLAAIAGSMVTVAATVFSITMLTLSSASQQFGPRVLRNFMRDRWNQVTLGTFTGTFAYALLVLRTAGRKHGGEFVPNLSVSVGVLLALFAVVVLVLFIHHISVHIQGPWIVARVGRELDDAIDEFFPEDMGKGVDNPPPGLPEGPSAECVFANSGYVDAIGEGALKAAAEHQLIVQLLARPGDFVNAGQPCARAWPRDRITDEVNRRIAPRVYPQPDPHGGAGPRFHARAIDRSRVAGPLERHQRSLYRVRVRRLLGERDGTPRRPASPPCKSDQGRRAGGGAPGGFRRAAHDRVRTADPVRSGAPNGGCADGPHAGDTRRRHPPPGRPRSGEPPTPSAPP